MTKRGRICSKSLARVIVMILIMSLCLCGCNKQSSNTPTNESSSQQTSEVTKPSEESKEDASKEDTSESKQEESKEESKETEESKEESSQEQPELSGDYLKEVAETEIFEMVLSDYNSDYVVGDTVTITMDLECTSAFNGSLGTCVGTDYAWEQSEFNAEAGTYTLSWKIKPSVDMAQLGIWYSGGTKVGVKAIDVTIEEPEIGLKGNYIKLLQAGDNWEMKLSDYNSAYVVGDYVNLEITFESDGDFNGAVGACIGKDYAWNQKEYAYDASGTYIFSWKFKPSTDMAQVGVWWVGGSAVGIKDIKVTVEEQPIGITGDYIEIFTDGGIYEFKPSSINPHFSFGDSIRVTVELESDGAFNGCMGTCVGNTYAWQQTEYNSGTGISTWVLEVAPTADLVQIGLWWLDGSAVGIRSINVDITYWGYKHDKIVGEIYTAEGGDVYEFKPSDYCEFEDGDIITIEAELWSNEVFNGRLFVSDASGKTEKLMTKFDRNGGTVVASLVLEANKDDVAKIEFWWANSKVALNKINVFKGGTIKVDEPGEWTIIGSSQNFYAPDYGKYEEGDTIKVEATFTGDGAFNGQLGMAGTSWCQADFTTDKAGTVTASMEVPGAYLGDVKISMWWIGGSKVTLDSLKVTVVETSSEETPDDGTDDGNTGEDVPEVEGTLIFAGDANESYDVKTAEDMAWLLEAADDDVVTIVYKAEAGKNGWGVLGWGAQVGETWVDGPSYSADTADSTKTMTVTTTAAELKEALKIEEDSEVTNIKLGAWNSGQIVSLSIAKAGEAEDDVTPTPTPAPEVTPDLSLADTSYDFDVKEYLPDVKAGDTVLITATITTESTGVFNGGIGMHDANTTNEDGGHWKQVAYDKAGEHTLEVTILEMIGDDGSPYLSTNGSVQLWWPNANAGYDVELFVELTAELVESEVAPTATPAPEATATPAPEATATPVPVVYNFAYNVDDADEYVQEKYAFLIKDYVSDVEAGDTVKITAEFASDTWYGGGIKANIVDDTATEGYSWGDVASFDQDSKTVSGTMEVPFGAGYNTVEIQMWWMGNTDAEGVDLVSLTVEKVEAEPEATATPVPEATATPAPEATATPVPEATATPVPEATATPVPEATATPEPEATATPAPEATPTPEPVVYNYAYTTDDSGTYVQEAYKFKLSDYIADVAQGDKVKITATFSGTAGFGGAIQGNIVDAEN